MPAGLARPSRSMALAATAAAAGLVIAGGAGSSPAAATTPARPCTVTPPSEATFFFKKPLLSSVTLSDNSAVVEVHGEIKAKGMLGGEFTVFGCLAAGKPVGYADFGLLKAPKSSRWLATLTTANAVEADGTVLAIDPALFSFHREKTFSEAAKQAKRTATLDGLKGPVYAEHTKQPLDLIATKFGKKTVTFAAKEAAARAFLAAYGAYPPHPG